MKRMLRLGIALLMILAFAMIITHLHMPGQTISYRMDAPKTADCTMVRPPLPSGDVDVNRAGLDELDKLPGVGPAIAQRIIDEREAGGPFHYPEDLLCVSGIGEKTLEKIRDQICIP